MKRESAPFVISLGSCAVTCLMCCLLSENVAWGCPNCRDGLAGDPDQANFVQGLFVSIMFLLSMPFLILGSLCGYFYWHIRRARAISPFVASNSPLNAPTASLTEHAAVEDELEVAGV